MTTHDWNYELPPPEAYARQATIVDQRALSASTVTLEGGGALADLIALGLGGLGIGRVALPSAGERGIAASLGEACEAGATPLEELLTRLAPGTKCSTHQELSAPTCVVMCERGTASVHQERNAVYARADNTEETVMIAGAALAYIAAICQGRRPLTRQFSPPKRRGLVARGHTLHDAKIALVGAGAIGTFCAIGSVLAGARHIDIIDEDTVEYTNLNRQVLFYERIGEPKATVLHERIRRLAPVEGSPVVANISSITVDLLAGHDLIFSCVDTKAPRKILNEYACEKKIALIDGGTSALGGQALAYVPGETSCIGCRREIDSPDERPSNSCQRSPTPSIIFPNMVIGAMMVRLARDVIDGVFTEEIITYDARENTIYDALCAKRRESCGCGRGR